MWFRAEACFSLSFTLTRSVVSQLDRCNVGLRENEMFVITKSVWPQIKEKPAFQNLTQVSGYS